MAALCKDSRQLNLFALLEGNIPAPAPRSYPVLKGPEDDIFKADDLDTFESEKGYQFLTAEEEARLVIAYKNHGDQKAGRQLYEAFMPALWSIARQKCAIPAYVEDAFQAASLGFFEALRGFEPERGFRLFTFINRNVGSHVLQMLRKNHVTSMTIGTKGRGLYYRILREEVRSKKESGGTLSYEDLEKIAEETASDIQQVTRMHESLTARVVDVHGEAQEISGGMYGEDTPQTSPEDEVNDREVDYQRKMIIEACLEELDPREREIIRARFFSDKKESLKSLGDRFGVSNEYIRRIQETALVAMKTRAVKLAREGNVDVLNLL